MSDDDAQLVALLTDLQLALRLYVGSLMPGDPSASDVAQQANAKIWEKRTEFQLGSNFQAWAFAIARYEVLTYRRQQARDRRLVFGDDLAEALADDFESRRNELAERQDAVRGCLDRLRAKDRALLMHRYAEPSTLAEYAKRVDRSVAGLKVSLHRLRNVLLECVQRRLAEDVGR